MIMSSMRMRDRASALFILAFALNTTLLAACASPWLAVPLCLLQALLLLGGQEVKHLAVHRSFLRSHFLNDLAGTCFAALIGENFTAFRYFHFKHHLAACNADDPEGKLYALSWRTRWIWALAPLEVFWVAFHLNGAGRACVPGARRMAHRLSTLAWLLCAGMLLAWACHAPYAFLRAYAIPLWLAAWIDFPLTQAEHYGVAVAATGTRRDSAALAQDIVLPFGLGWLMLHRSLHQVHHGAPQAAWVSAPDRLRANAAAVPVPYGVFVRRWLRDGPRLWQTESGAAAAPDAAQVRS